MNSKEYLLKLIKEELEETASGANSFSEFIDLTDKAHKPIDLGNSNYNPNPRMGFIYHGCYARDVESIRTTGASGSKEFFGHSVGQVYGRGLYAYLDPRNNSYGDGTIVEFAVKPGAFDNFIIFEDRIREDLFKRGLITRRNETVTENIRRLVGKDVFEYLLQNGLDLRKNGYISHSSFYRLMTSGERSTGRGATTEARLDTTKIDGWCLSIGGPAAVVRRMDILIPNRIKMRGSDRWEYAIRNEKEFDNLNLYFDAHARVKGEYPDTSFNQKPSAGFMLVGDNKKGNLVNLRTGEYFSPVPLKNCTGFSNVKEYGFNIATFTLGKTEYTLRTSDDGKTVQVLFKPKGWNELLEMEGGEETFKKLAEMGIDGSVYAKIIRNYPTTNLEQDMKAGMIQVGDENRGNFIDLSTLDTFSPIPLKNCTPFSKGDGGYVATFTLGKNQFELITNGGIANCTVRYFSAQENKLKEMEGGYQGFLKLMNALLAKMGKKPINESFMTGTFDDFKNNEIPNTTTLYSRSNNLNQFASDVKGGKNIYFYTCSKADNAKSMMQNGMTYEFTGTSNDTTTFQGVVAYGSFSLAGAERNMNLGYGNAIYKFVLKDDLSKYIIFDPRIRSLFGFGGEKLSDQIKRMCAGKKYNGRPLIEVLDYGLKHPVRGYGQNPHLYKEGVNGLDHLSTSTQGDACASFFTALKGAMKGRLNGATMYDEEPIHLMGIHGYIYNGGNHWDCICVRNYNALMPVAYTVSRSYGSSGLPRDEKGHIIWKENEYMNQEWFDRMNNNVTARFQYAGEYSDTPMNTKQSCGFTLVNGKQGYNFMDVRTHRHLLPIDVKHASRFTKVGGIPTANFEFFNSNWELYLRDGRIDLVRNGTVIPGDKFIQLIKAMIIKGALPKDTKIHTDAIIGGDPIGALNEGVNRTVNKGLRGGIDNLKAQEARINEKGDTLYNSEQASYIINRIGALLMSDKQSVAKAKESLLRIFEEDATAAKMFKDQDAREFAAFAVYGQKSPIEYNPETNRYYHITSQMVSAGSKKSDEQIAIELNQERKQKRDQKALKYVEVQKDENLQGVTEIIKKSGFKNFYLKGNVIYMFILNKKGDATKTGWEEWVSLERKLHFAGYVTTKPRKTSIKVKGINYVCAFVNVDRKEDLNESIEVHTAKEPDGREYTTQADFPKLKKCSKCGKDSFFLMTISDQRNKDLKDGEQDTDVIGSLDDDGNWKPSEYQAIAVYKCPHCFHMDTLNNMA